MEFSFPVPKQNEILGQFSNKWSEFVTKFRRCQDPNGTKFSLLLHFGANAIKEAIESHHLTSDEVDKFSSIVETLESECLFQISLSFFRYLFFNHCHKGGPWIEDFYTELKLLSEMCSFDTTAIDNFIKSHIINNFQEESVRDVFLSAANLSAREVVDVCSKVEKHAGLATPELFQSYLMELQHKSFQNSSKVKKDYGWSSYQDAQPEMMKSTNLSGVFLHESHYNTNEVIKSNYVDNAGKFTSFPNATFPPTDPLSDLTYVPNNIPSAGVSYHQPTEGSSNFIHLPPSTHYTSSSCEESTASYAFPSAMPPPPSVPSLPSCPTRKESAKAKTKKALDKNVAKPIRTTASAISSCTIVTPNPSITSSTTSSTGRSDPRVLGSAIADNNDTGSMGGGGDSKLKSVISTPDLKAKANSSVSRVEETDKDKTPPISLEFPKGTNEVLQAYCSQQKALLKTSQMMENTGQSIDIYTCNFCAYSCPGKDVMEKHALHEHKSLNCFVCTVCNAKFPSKEQFESHFRTKHMNMEEHKCQICDMVFGCQKQLFGHLQGHAKTRTVACRVCRAMFPTEKLLSCHMASVHPKTERWNCSLCSGCFSTRKLFVDHMVDKHKGIEELKMRRFMCKKCGINFMDKKSSDMHKRKLHIKPKLRRFPCELCSHVCTSNANLISHRRIHTGEKPYMCEVCGKEFAQLSSLDKHTRIHTGEKPYKCQYCEFAFKTSSNRLVHERIHRNERPYICEQCGKTFRNSYELKMHINTHNKFRIKKFLCHCGSAFDTKKKLKRHEICHTGIKPYKCDACGAGFTRPENLRGHQKSQACHNRVSKLS